MKKAFTLIELIVAIALLAMIFLFASTIFKVSIDSYRTSAANAEIMQKLRVITGQLNADFEGAIRNYPAKIQFRTAKSRDLYGNLKDVRSDSIIFFANGDFQSTGQYYDSVSASDKTVLGDVACIFYAIADVSSYTLAEKRDPQKKILIRRQIIFTSDPNWPTRNLNKWSEYCTTPSLEEIIAGTATFDPNDPKLRDLDLGDSNDLVNYMAKGVDDFTIQYVGDEVPISKNMNFNQWRPDTNDIPGWPEGVIIKAFKFTFTLYDSMGIIKEGRKFTHIVYLD